MNKADAETLGRLALAPAPPECRPTWRGHARIMRADHWFKNVFVVPGLVAAVGLDPQHVPGGLAGRVLLGLLSVCLVASSNYVINEVLDAPFDRVHPLKCTRPVPSGAVSVPLAYVQWLALMVLGVATGALVSTPYAVTVAALWVMGCAYNVPPLRTKDLPYLDVLSEAVNNPLRMLAGWFMAGTTAVLPLSLLMSYWMVGCYFMALKRFAEYRDIGNPLRATAYRRSFGVYTEESLLVSVMFYAAAAMLCLGAFVMRYRLELILDFPLIALVMAIYLSLSFKADSAVQRPEDLYREPRLMAAVMACSLAATLLLLVHIPGLHHVLRATVRTNIGM